MVVQRIFEAGNDLAVSLPKETTQDLGLTAGSEVHVELAPNGRHIVITPVGQQPGIDEDFVRQVAAFIEQYRPALNALSQK